MQNELTFLCPFFENRFGGVSLYGRFGYSFFGYFAPKGQ